MGGALECLRGKAPRPLQAPPLTLPLGLHSLLNLVLELGEAERGEEPEPEPNPNCDWLEYERRCPGLPSEWEGFWFWFWFW